MSDFAPYIVFLLLGVAATLLGGFIQQWQSSRGTRRSAHDLLAAGLTGATVTDSARKLVTEGRRAGCRLRLTSDDTSPSLFYRDDGPRIVYEVEVPGWEGDLSLDAKQARAWVGAGAHVDEARGAVGHLFGIGIQQLEIQDGWLRVRRLASDYAYRPGSLEAVFHALERLAPLFSRAKLTIRVADADVHVRGWSVDEQVLCPFCRDALGSVSDDLTACDACHTAHHRECLTEAGSGCTVFGCAGRASGSSSRERLES